MEKPIISIITAVFNVEKYINKCINSILNQTFTNFELLLIDDGSEDQSGIICDHYALKDNRIRVFHKKNGGVASARKLGTEMAQGLFSIHIDPDDWIDNNMLEEMYNQIIAEKADLLIADYYVETPDKTIYINKKPNSLSSKDLLSDLLKGTFFGGLCHKLVRHSIYQKYKIQYYEGINYCEDFLIWAQLLQHSLNTTYLNKAYYHYYVGNSNSISRNYTIESYHQRKKFYYTLQEIIPKNYRNLLSHIATSIKLEAFYNGLMNRKEFREFAPTKMKNIIFDSKINIRNKIYILIAVTTSFKIAYNIYKIMHK